MDVSEDSTFDRSCLRKKDVEILLALCSNSSILDIKQCESLPTVVNLLKIDCYINRIFYPLVILLILIGTILNLLSLYCFLKTNKRSSQNIYLSALSLGDTINLHINYGLPMLRKFEIIDTTFRSLGIACRITGVFTEFFLIFPTWIVVLLTIERLITISSPTRNRPPYTQKQAIISIMILVLLVFILSFYRLFDSKGIDQLSAFSVVACNDAHRIEWLRNMNLIIWAILPECLTFILSLIIIYKIKSVTKNMNSNSSKIHRSQYNQATRAVLLIAILFLVFHTPTGITIGIHLFYGSNGPTLKTVLILFSRKITMLLYEISLSCKFFIYNRTFRNFMGVLSTSVFQFERIPNSAKLGRSAWKNAPERMNRPKIQFNSQHKQSLTSPISQSDSCAKHVGIGGGGGGGYVEEHQPMLNNRHPRTTSTNLSRIQRDQQPLNVIMSKTNNEPYVSLLRRADI
ncbi:hypothetical protein I4U23_021245 [Adineta vaga]|nr:hypothetical protein I4U23_021245 [Adineta vaga]